MMLPRWLRLSNVLIGSALLGGLLFSNEAALAQGVLHGHGRFEKIKGDPSKGYVELYEYKAFLTPTGTGSGYSYHMGDPGSAIDPYTGCFTFRDIPAGTYTLMNSWGEFYPRGRIVSGVVISNGVQTNQNADEPIDYSGYYDKGQWDPSGSNPIFQTFVATGTSITRASFAKADASAGGSIDVSIHQSNGGNVESWSQVGPTRSVNRGGSGSDHWVGWDAGQVTTTPGQTYAIRLSATNGVNIQPYWSDDNFYTGGKGYRGSQANPANHDYYIVVFSDNDGTIHTITNRTPGFGNLAGWWEKWAQSYTARGNSFAGSTLMGTRGGASGWDFDVKVHVHSGTPGGPQVGPTKTMPCAFAPFTGVAGAAFAPGEVPTTIGQTYWVVYEAADSGGFNAVRMNESDTYSNGTSSYFNGSWNNQNYDLLINLFEYAAPSGPPTSTPTVTPTPIGGANLLNNPSFESSSGNNHPSWTNNTDVGTDGLFPNPGGAHDGQHWASYSYGNGGTSSQELYQTVAVQPGHTYRVSTWYQMGGTNGTAVAELAWTNGGYPGAGNGTEVQSANWANPDPIIPWTQLSGFITPTGSTLTIILRIEINGFGAGVNFDDCFLQDQSAPPTPTHTPIGNPTATPTATIVLTPTPPGGTNLLSNPSFELSSGQNHPSWTNSGFGTDGMFPSPGSAKEGLHWADYSFGGGGTVFQELYQTVSTVPGHTYDLSTWCYIGGNNGSATAELRWFNGGYGGAGNGAILGSQTWSDGAPFVTWTEMSSQVTPTGSSLTFVLRAEINGYGGGVLFDACAAVDITAPVTPTRTPTSVPTTPIPSTPTATRTPTGIPAATATPTLGGATPTPDLDFNNDGIVDQIDLLFFTEHWHETSYVAQ